MSGSVTTRPAPGSAGSAPPAGAPVGDAPHQGTAPAAGERWGPLEAVRVRAVAPGVVRCHARDAEAGVDVELRLYDPEAETPGWPSATLADDSARRASLRHPHLLWVLGAQAHLGKWGIWTEQARGHTLESLLRERGPLDAAQTAALGGELCGALAALHGHGLVQGRLDATHVRIASDGRARLCDPYPTAAAAGSEGGDPRPGPFGRSPETDPTAAGDLYALGALLLRVLVGEAPTVDAARALLRGGQAPRVTPPESVGRRVVPEVLAQAIERATDPRPGARYPSAVAMGVALAEAHERAARANPGEHVARTVHGDDDRARPARRQLWQHAALTLVTLLALALMAVIVWTAAE